MKQEFTDQDLLQVLEEGLWYQYCKYPAIQSYMEFEDLVHDCVLDWYEIMKSTGEVRIEHYRKTMDYKHLRNTVKLYTYQVVPNYLRTNALKYRPLSLNKAIGNDEDDNAKEYIDLIPSLDEDVLLGTINNDIITILTDEEQDILIKLMEGYTKTSLREKYKRFDYIIDDAKQKIASYYYKSKENIPDSINKYLDRI